MSNIIYKTTLYKAGALVIGKPASNDTDLIDFETNFKTITAKVDEVILAETTVVIEKTYADFKALIVSPVAWGDVKHLDVIGKYELNLLTGA